MRGRRGLGLGAAALVGMGLLFVQPNSTPADEGTPPGQIEVAVTSTKSPLVTGGDARVEVRGLQSGDTLHVALDDGRDVTAVFTRHEGVATGVVSGLRIGENELVTTVEGPAGRRVAMLPIVNHPITGPVISGPHQEPFVCETEQAGMGEPLDEDCSAPTKVQWFARDDDGAFAPLADPYAPYPEGTVSATTRDGRTVPFVVRVESSVINRSITRVAVLDDPQARGRAAPYTPSAGWNRSVIHQFGESCGTGYHQGRNQVDSVLGSGGFDAENLAGALVAVPSRLADGYAYVHSTLTIFGVHCNQILSAETMMMVKEHLIEAYGPVEQVLGVGASGGALQQYTIIDGYPGLLDAGVPILSFPDVVSTAMSTVDCGLLDRLFDGDPNRWHELKRQAISGFLTGQMCQDWVDLFLNRLDPIRGCDGIIPDELIYHPVTNRGGARCTVQDSAVNVLGRDPATGFANRPVDNTGVQYGLGALDAGMITIQDFLDLNRHIGGYDIDANWIPQRMAMPDAVAARVYEYGGVTGRGAPEQTPIIDIRINVDAVPILGFHDQRRPFLFEERLRERGYESSLAIWTGVPLPGDALRVAHAWADAADALDTGDRATAVARAVPPEGNDRCTVPASVELANLDLGPIPLLDVPACPELLSLVMGDTPRIVAGGPPTEDVVKCARRAPQRGDYPAGMTDAQFAQVQAIFPTGVCDYAQPGVGQTDRSLTWASVGGDELKPPFQVHDVVARSSEAPAVAPDIRPVRTTLPATGASTPLAALAAFLLLGTSLVAVVRRARGV